MELTGKEVQWACIVAGATCYFFLGALTETALALQFAVLLAVGVVLPTILTRTTWFEPLASLAGVRLITDVDPSRGEREYK